MLSVSYWMELTMFSISYLPILFLFVWPGIRKRKFTWIPLEFPRCQNQWWNSLLLMGKEYKVLPKMITWRIFIYGFNHFYFFFFCFYYLIRMKWTQFSIRRNFSFEANLFSLFACSIAYRFSGGKSLVVVASLLLIGSISIAFKIAPIPFLTLVFSVINGADCLANPKFVMEILLAIIY